MHRTEFLVSTPLQGLARFASQSSEVVMSDVYWRWIFDSLKEQGCAQAKVVEEGFTNPSRLVESIVVDEAFEHALASVDVTRAPSFGQLTAASGGQVPSPDVVLRELRRVVGEARSVGSVEMEIE